MPTPGLDGLSVLLYPITVGMSIPFLTNAIMGPVGSNWTTKEQTKDPTAQQETISTLGKSLLFGTTAIVGGFSLVVFAPHLGLTMATISSVALGVILTPIVLKGMKGLCEWGARKIKGAESVLSFAAKCIGVMDSLAVLAAKVANIGVTIFGVVSCFKGIVGWTPVFATCYLIGGISVSVVSAIAHFIPEMKKVCSYVKNRSKTMFCKAT